MSDRSNEIVWFRYPRKDAEDEFHEEYRGFNIYLSIPNGGILGASIIEIDSTKKAWIYIGEILKDPHYSDSEWHVNNAKFKIDELLEKWAKQKPRKQRSPRVPKGQLSLNLEV